MIQIRNVPDALHRQLKSRAALAGMSLSDYLLSEIRRVAGRPTLDALRVRLDRRSETDGMRQIARSTVTGAARLAGLADVPLHRYPHEALCRCFR